jgi:hypothetical protein
VSPTAIGFNFALNVSLGTTTPDGSEVAAVGIGNIAVNFLGNGTTLGGHVLVAQGNLNTATTLGGTNSKVEAGLGTGTFNHAFSIFGTNNQVAAGPGPLAIAGSILQTGTTITKVGPGFNINGFTVGGAAAVNPTPTATTVSTTKKTTTASSAAGTGSSARK